MVDVDITRTSLTLVDHRVKVDKEY